MLLKKISVILPVYNEAAMLGSTIQNLRASSTRIPIEIIVVDGQSSDNTRAVAESCADQVLVAPKPGRGTQMHLGAQKALGDLLLFLHADTQLPSDWQMLIEKRFSGNGNAPVASAFTLSFDSDRFVFKFLAFLADWRSKWTGVPHGDQALAVTRQSYSACGGFPDVPLMEEYLIIPKLRRLGKVEILKEKVVTSGRKYLRKGPIRNALKNSLLIFLFYLGISPQKIAEWY